MYCFNRVGLFRTLVATLTNLKSDDFTRHMRGGIFFKFDRNLNLKRGNQKDYQESGKKFRSV